MSTPLVSLIIPLFNREKFITETITSLQRQTYANWEAIIIDDQSMDNSFQIVKELAESDHRIKLTHRQSINKGAPICRNEGIGKAIGKYIIFLDSDDLLAPYALGNRVNYMESNLEYDFAVFPGLVFHEKPGDNNLLISDKINDNGDLIPCFLNFDVPWVIFMPIWRMSVLIENNLYFDEETLSYQDIQFSMVALCKGLKYTIVDSPPDSYWRHHKDGNIGQKVFHSSHFRSHIRLFSKLKAQLDRSNLLGKEEKKAINRLVHKLIFSNMHKKEYKEALDLLFYTKDNSLIGPTRFCFIFLILQFFRFIQRINKRILHYFYLLAFYAYFKPILHYENRLFLTKRIP